MLSGTPIGKNAKLVLAPAEKRAFPVCSAARVVGFLSVQYRGVNSNENETYRPG